MCLGLPARVLRRDPTHADLVVAEVGGAARSINVALLDTPPEPGDWVMVHMGFALEPMTPAQAAEALAVLSADAEVLEDLLAARPDGADLRPY